LHYVARYNPKVVPMIENYLNNDLNQSNKLVPETEEIVLEINECRDIKAILTEIFGYKNDKNIFIINNK
jgi:hypothetical protein